MEAFTSQCMNEVRTNITLRQDDVIYDSIVSSICPNDCRYEGKKTGDCVEGWYNSLSKLTYTVIHKPALKGTSI